MVSIYYFLYYKLKKIKTAPYKCTVLLKERTTKKQPKFKLPENFADYQQECDDLVDELSAAAAATTVSVFEWQKLLDQHY
jgi:hypothetical protein